MWSEATTQGVVLNCRPPFSFFFDLVSRYWKAQTNPAPLHRICTLTRKQDATYVLVECALSNSDVRREIDTLDKHYGGGGLAEAVAFSFFCNECSPAEISTLPNDSLLAHAILLNYQPPNHSGFAISYIYEAILTPPRRPKDNRLLLNNFISADASFDRCVSGRAFRLKGVYYCQQNGVTHVCAHATLRMALNSAGDFARTITNEEIVGLVGSAANGLTADAMQKVVTQVAGLESEVLVGRTPEAFCGLLAATVESGHVAMLGFKTKKAAHVVPVFGHTRNTDEWHPQALRAYSGPAGAHYLPSASWINHFLIHDDNFGPHYTLSARALELNNDVQADSIITILPKKPTYNATIAEAIASGLLRPILAQLSVAMPSRWLTYALASSEFVLRSVLITREQLLAHLSSSLAHDNSRATHEQIARLNSAPDLVWMVEYSLPQLLTGNRSKLGEIVLDATSVNRTAAPMVVSCRAPSVFGWAGGTGSLTLTPGGLSSHSPIFQCREYDNCW